MKKSSAKKVLMSTTLGILVMGMLAANELILRTDLNVDAVSDRTPASEIYRNMRSGSLIAERRLASELSQLKDRALASVGHSANAFDQFKFGVLEGKYALVVENEKVKDISYMDKDTEEGPTKVSDRVEFLRSHAQVLNLKNKIVKLSTDINGSKIVETYKAYMKDSSNQVVVRIELDEMDRLYNISVL